MDNTLFARGQMAVSLAFHIIFAAIGMAMPLLMALAETQWLRTKRPEYLALAKAWAKGTAVFFAVGAVSGTVLSFELGLLFPEFMKRAGAIIGLPFSLEGFAFFTESIFLGIYLYGWEKVSPALHLFSGYVVALSGVASAIFVTLVNAWMNAPSGIEVLSGKITSFDPITAMFSPFAFHETTHMVLAAFMAVSFAVAGIHAFQWLSRGENPLHRAAIEIALLLAIPTTLVQPLIGHIAGQQVARYQPLKFAAMESQFESMNSAPLHLGGIRDDEQERMKYSIEIPMVLSFLATNDFHGRVPGLKQFPKQDWPSPVVHYAFQGMVGIGTFLGIFVLWLAGRGFGGRLWKNPKPFLRALVIVSPLAFVALELGWIVTEVGRQPWIIYEVLRTKDSVTPMPGLVVPFTLFTGIYVFLGALVIAIFRRQVRSYSQFSGGTQS